MDLLGQNERTRDKKKSFSPTRTVTLQENPLQLLLINLDMRTDLEGALKLECIVRGKFGRAIKKMQFSNYTYATVTY